MKLNPLSTAEIQSRKSLSLDQALRFLQVQSHQPKQKEHYHMFIQTDGRYLCLKNAPLSGAVLSHMDLSGADLSGANLSGANLSGANLSGANLSGANLSGAILDHAILDQTNLAHADLRKVLLDQIDLRHAFLTEATFDKIPSLKPYYQSNRYLRSNHQIYHFVETKPFTQSSKTVCIAFHGFAGIAQDFDWLATNLQIPMRVIHLAGHHASTFADLAEIFSHESFENQRLGIFNQKVDELADLLDQMLKADHFDDIILIGYSMGARVALALSDHPKIQAKIKKLILIGANPGLDLKEDQEARWLNDLAWIEQLFRSRLNAFLKKWYQQDLLSSFEKNEAQRFQNRIIDQCRFHDQRGLAYAMYCYSLGNQPNLWPKLSQIKIPTLWLNGSLDSKFCEIARKATLIQDSSIAVEIQGVGHQMMFERPDLALEQILLFLRTHQ